MMLKKSLLAAATLLMILITSPALSYSIVFQDDFESGIVNSWAKEICCEHSLKFVKTSQSLKQQENRSILFTLKKIDPDIHSSKRAELALKPVPQNSEYTYKFSLFLPSKYTVDPSFEILAQWHSIPDFDLGETWRSPPLALVTKNGEFELRRSWDSEPVTENEKRNKESIDLGAYATGEWIDWIFHVKWSYESDGLIEVWKNGELILTKEGANTYNDKTGTYFKIGIYKPDWKYNPEKSKTNLRMVRYDNVEISEGNNAYFAD